MAEHGRLAAGSSEKAKLDIGGEAGQAVVILILIAVLWLSVVTVIVSACRVAARAEAAEDDRRAHLTDQRRPPSASFPIRGAWTSSP